jgi:hypothetical protein
VPLGVERRHANRNVPPREGDLDCEAAAAELLLPELLSGHGDDDPSRPAPDLARDAPEADLVRSGLDDDRRRDRNG